MESRYSLGTRRWCVSRSTSSFVILTASTSAIATLRRNLTRSLRTFEAMADSRWLRRTLDRSFSTKYKRWSTGICHSGSVMVTEGNTRVIDPEFAFYGPIGFDLGAFLGNLLLSWYSQPGHATEQDNRIAYQQWILEQTKIFWESFRRNFLALWAANADGDVLPVSMFTRREEAISLELARSAFVEGLFADMLGFGACKMIRRIVGFAHVIDFDWIRDAAVRAGCEAGALAMARTLLTHPAQFHSIQEVIDAVPRMVRH